MEQHEARRAELARIADVEHLEDRLPHGGLIAHARKSEDRVGRGMIERRAETPRRGSYRPELQERELLAADLNRRPRRIGFMLPDGERLIRLFEEPAEQETLILIIRRKEDKTGHPAAPRDLEKRIDLFSR